MHFHSNQRPTIHASLISLKHFLDLQRAVLSTTTCSTRVHISVCDIINVNATTFERYARNAFGREDGCLYTDHNI